MRLVVAIVLGVLAVGALVTWATDSTIGEATGAILMICAAVGLLALTFFSASRSAAEQTELLESEAVDEPDDRLSAGWPHR